MLTLLLTAALAMAGGWHATATAYSPTCAGCSGVYAHTGTRASFARGNPRSLAVSDAALRGRDPHLPPMPAGSRWIVEFPGGSRITYTVRDRCPACHPGQVDLLVVSQARARQVGHIPVTLHPAK